MRSPRFERVRTAFEPALPLAQMEAFGSVGTDMAPAAFIAIGTWNAYYRLLAVFQRASNRRRTVLEPVARSFLRVVGQLVELVWGQEVVVRVFAYTSLLYYQYRVRWFGGELDLLPSNTTSSSVHCMAEGSLKPGYVSYPRW